MNGSADLTTNSRFAPALRGLLRAGLLPALLFCLTATTGRAAMEAFRVATGLTLPLYVCAPVRDSTRIFVAEQGGKIKIVDLTTNTVLPTPYLDITNRVGQGQGTGTLTSLGVDAYGELYMTDLNGNVFEIRKGRD